MCKKVLFIGSNPKVAGGIETFGRNLQEVFKENISFYSFYKSTNVLYDVKNVIEILPYNILFRGINKIFKGRLSDYFLNRIIPKYDVLLINNPNDLNKISEKNKNKKIILIQHQTSKSFLERKDYLNRDEKLLEKMKKEPNKIVTLSPFDTEDFIQKFNLDKNKVSDIRHSSKLEIIDEPKEKTKKLITICRLVNVHKRIDLMLEGMKELPDFNLEIWGDGVDKEMLEEKMKNLNITNVQFMGKTSNVKEKLDNASIFLMTSDYEGYPIATIEAIRRGLPLVVRNTFVSAQDLISENGVLLKKEWNKEEFKNAINEIYENYEFYTKDSIKLAKKYDFSIFKKSWIDEISSS
ncbi:MAG: glycosyltransferase [Cetobacterium sp.]